MRKTNVAALDTLADTQIVEQCLEKMEARCRNTLKQAVSLGKTGADERIRTADLLITNQLQWGIRTGQDASLRTKLCRRGQESAPATEIFAQIRTRLRSAVPP
jgi:hypothetical protein